MSHRSNEDTDRVRVGDGGEVVTQAHGLGVEGQGCRRTELALSRREEREQKRTDFVALRREVVGDWVLQNRACQYRSIRKKKGETTHLNDLQQLLRPVDRTNRETVQQLDCKSQKQSSVSDTLPAPSF